jgi:L-seryl-tRNA(Ser) seleniumtransferase
MGGDGHRRLRALPSVRALLDQPDLQALVAASSRAAVLDAARQALAAARPRLLAGEDVRVGPAEVAAALDATLRPRLRRVINATGVVLHTNLGRAPLSPLALEWMAEAARGATNLELRLEDGRRGGRDDGIADHLHALVGAERAFAVNNGAAAALLALTAVASGREVLVSRGELVEIGGGFRVPEVLAQGGCRLVEVGTTNRTRAADYARAIGPATGALLKVHRSNFAMTGFVEEASLAELAPLARAAGVPLLYDQGTGALAAVRDALAKGSDLLTFSGDKLLGGPQAGLVAGKAELVERVRRHPLARALRTDKLVLAALEATLALHRAGRTSELPALRMLAEPAESVRARAEALATQLGALGLEPVVVASAAETGGGARPGEVLPSFAVRLSPPDPQRLARALRRGRPAVLGRLHAGGLLLDARTLAPDEVELVAAAVAAATQASARPADAEATNDGTGEWEAGEDGSDLTSDP